MSPDFFKKISQAFRVYNKQIQKVELSVLNENQHFLEVYERNVILERENAERAEELMQTNKSILALSNILDNINSSQPLIGILNTIAKGIVSDMGYHHACIWQVFEEDGKKLLRLRKASHSSIFEALRKNFELEEDKTEISFDNADNAFIKCVKNQDIVALSKVSEFIKAMGFEANQEQFKVLASIFKERAVRILPIKSQKEPFGCVAVFASQKEISVTEKNFLDLFVNQIGVAVTIAKLFEHVKQQADTDPLTGLYNRRYFNQMLEKEAQRAKRSKQPFSLVCLDLDYLKKINDTLGHASGDKAIKAISNILLKNARSIDTPARLGGEEFAIILPGVDTKDALIVAERYRKAIEESTIEGLDTITASIGVSVFLRHTDSATELMDMADDAMYSAKRKGRNQVRCATKEDREAWQTKALETFLDILKKDNMPIDNKFTSSIVSKLESANEQNSTEMLYQVADSLTSIYDPFYKEGIIVEKVAMAVELAKRIKLGQSEIDKIKLAIFLYDIGNIMLPKEILKKAGPLNAEEQRRVLEHPVIAAKELLKPIKSAQDIITLVEHHHESWDGHGYPYNLSGNEIPIGSRIILIVDSYFAMINDRAYRSAMTKAEALETLKAGANNKWDGRLVDVFAEILEEKIKII